MKIAFFAGIDGPVYVSTLVGRARSSVSSGNPSLNPAPVSTTMALPKTLALAGLLLLGTGCINENEKESVTTPTDNPETSDFSSDTAKQWLDLVTNAIDTENLNPPEASRRIGYAGVTLYEAVVAGIPDHRSLGEQLNGLGEMPEKPDDNVPVHWPSAANAALADVLTELFAGASAPTLQSITDLEAAQAAAFALTVPANEIANGVGHGEDVASEIIDWIAEDGYALFNDCPYVVPVGVGLWAPTPPAFAPPLEPCWGNLRPLVLHFAADCAPIAPPAFTLAPGWPFALEAQEVYDTVNNLTVEQQEIATFWADGGGTLTPPGHWVSITGIVLEQEGEDLDVAAEAYAKVGLAVADAFIACWEIKYVYNLLRPVTYIRDPAGPINDPAWNSFIGTPPFPEFSSGHSTQSAAVATVLTDLFGDIAFTDDTHAAVPLPARSFDSFTEAAEEAAISRLYGGIHFRAAIQNGLAQGQCIAGRILQDIEFRE